MQSTCEADMLDLLLSLRDPAWYLVLMSVKTTEVITWARKAFTDKHPLFLFCGVACVHENLGRKSEIDSLVGYLLI